jgi:hypothetical protein
MRRMMLAVMLTIGLTTNALALEEIIGHVTLLEPTYLPGTIAFYLDNGSASCPVGRMLRWAKPDLENNKAVYATLLTAIAAGNRVRFYVNDGDTSCVGQFLHIFPGG